MPPHPGMYSYPRYFWRENKTTTFPPHCGDIGKVKTRHISPAITGTPPDQGGPWLQLTGALEQHVIYFFMNLYMKEEHEYVDEHEAV